MPAAPTSFTNVAIVQEVNPQAAGVAGTGNLTVAGNVAVTGSLSANGTQYQGGSVGSGTGVRTVFVKAQPGLVLPTGALVVTLFTITLPNVAAGGGFVALITMTDKTSPGASTRTAQITGSFQRVAAAVASGTVSALANNVQADNGGGHALTFGALAATQAGGATAVNTLAITCSITGATNTDTFDLMTQVELLNLEVNGAVLS